MKNSAVFERNLLALARANPDLCRRLSAAETTKGKYSLMMAKDGSPVPALRREDGVYRPLHSLFDPKKEAQRLVDTVKSDSFLILFGLGGGYVAAAALGREDLQALVVVEYDLDGLAELLASVDLVEVLADRRTTILVDPSAETLRAELLGRYHPALSGGLASLPLRSRVEVDQKPFASAAQTVSACLEAIGDDYGAQAYFGKRWFSNAIRNLGAAERSALPYRFPGDVAVTAAGPSLEAHLDALGRRKDAFILATDTTVPALLSRGIVPNAVISIDCQHISYYHFMEGLPDEVPLFVDLASPPVIVSGRKNVRFFAGGHPFTVYLAKKWRAFPFLDTSGGNVTHSAVALADRLGARRIELYGADFSYPVGIPYARGTYIYPYFARRQSRLVPQEAQVASFVLRNERLDLETDERGWRYVTKPLSAYRKRLEGLSAALSAQLVPMPGSGAAIRVAPTRERSAIIDSFAPGPAKSSYRRFLQEYESSLSSLPHLTGGLQGYFDSLDDDRRDVLTTILPTAAAVRRSEKGVSAGTLLAMTIDYCRSELRKVIDASR